MSVQNSNAKVSTRNMEDCIKETGKVLNINNQDIVKYLCTIEDERQTLEMIIQKQYQERKTIEAEIERLTYKLCLINKSLSMRIKAKNNYDRTIEEIKEHYNNLVDSSNQLRTIVEKTQQELDDLMNKKIGTNNGPSGEVKTLYVRSKGDQSECPCEPPPEIPTKENSESPTLTLTDEKTVRTEDNQGEKAPDQKDEPHPIESELELHAYIGNLKVSPTNVSAQKKSDTGTLLGSTGVVKIQESPNKLSTNQISVNSEKGIAEKTSTTGSTPGSGVVVRMQSEELANKELDTIKPSESSKNYLMNRYNIFRAQKIDSATEKEEDHMMPTVQGSEIVRSATVRHSLLASPLKSSKSKGLDKTK